MSMVRRRTDVDVYVKWKKDGEIAPQAIIWKDGTEFSVNDILNIYKDVPLITGGTGMCFSILVSSKEYMISNKRTHLFLDQGQSPEIWFVAGKEVMS